MQAPLTIEKIQESAPSVFAGSAHESRSQRYKHVPTIEVLQYLMKNGYKPTQAFQSNVRPANKDRFMYTRHLIRLRQDKYFDSPKNVGDVIPEVLLINSHDGSSSFRLEAGLYRLVCSNGLITKSKDYGSIRVHHTGNVLEEVRAAADDIVNSHLPKIAGVVEEWDKIKLSSTARIKFAAKACAMRYNGHSPITPEQALTVRRPEDEAQTLWRTYNVVEENLARGGVVGETATKRKSTTRSLSSVNNVLFFERNLWEMAEELARKA